MKRRTISAIFISVGIILFLFSYIFSATLVNVPAQQRIDSTGESVYNMTLSTGTVVTVIDVSGHYGLIPVGDLGIVNETNIASLSQKPYNITGIDNFNVTYTGLHGSYSFVYFNQSRENILVVMERNGTTASVSSILVFGGIALILAGAAIIPTMMKKK